MLSARSGHISLAREEASKKSNLDHFVGKMEASADDVVESDRQGQWLRRRRLDGALNRKSLEIRDQNNSTHFLFPSLTGVPRNFYQQVWSVLEKVIQFIIAMTSSDRYATGCDKLMCRCICRHSRVDRKADRAHNELIIVRRSAFVRIVKPRAARADYRDERCT